MQVAEYNTFIDFIIGLLLIFLLPIGILGVFKLDSLTRKFEEIVHNANVLGTHETPTWWNKKIWFSICIVLILGGVLSLPVFIINIIRYLS